MATSAADIIDSMSGSPLAEVLRELQRQQGFLGEEALELLARQRRASLTQVYAVAASFPGLVFDEKAERARPGLPEADEPDFFSRVVEPEAAAVLTRGPLAARFEDPPADLEAYRRSGGLEALARAREIKPEQVLSEVVLGKITRNTAGWQRAATALEPPVIVANACAGDPVAGQAQKLLAADAWAVLEGMFIASLALGAERGFVYVDPGSAERCRSLASVAKAMMEAWEPGFRVEVFCGPRSLVGSEESAVLAAIEGRRPLAGKASEEELSLWGGPVLVDGVEVFAAITAVLASGERVDTRLYQVSGAVVERPGIVEATPSVTVRELMETAGAEAGAEALLGGLSGVFLTEGELDQAVGELETADNPRWRTVHVLRDRRDIYPIAVQSAAYNAAGLCGYCVPCRIGSARMAEMLEHYPLDVQALEQVAALVVKTGICSAGRGAAGMVASALKHIV